MNELVHVFGVLFLGLALAVLAIRNDREWGEYNHKNGRSWSWRPDWDSKHKKRHPGPGR